jgi:hypothetical protein
MAGDKVLILGATGPAGIVLLREFLHRKHATIAYVRTPSKILQDLTSDPLLEVSCTRLSMWTARLIVRPGSLGHDGRYRVSECGNCEGIHDRISSRAERDARPDALSRVLLVNISADARTRIEAHHGQYVLPTALKIAALIEILVADSSPPSVHSISA